MRRFLTIIAIIISFIGCEKDDSYIPRGDENTIYQSTLIYFTGTSLSSNFRGNITDATTAIKEKALGKYGRFFYLLPSSSTKATLCEVWLKGNEATTEVIKEYTDFNTLSEGSMLSVVTDLKNEINYWSMIDGKTQRLNLIISGHGTGWVPKSYGTISSRARLKSDNYIYNWEGDDSDTPLTRYMGSTTDGFMDIDELETELSRINVKFGYIIFDECYMSSIELLYRLKSYSDYIIASPSEIMAEGFPYDTVLKYMYTENGLSFDPQGICEAYYDYFLTATNPYGCIALCVTDELDALANAQKRLTLRELDTSEINSIQSYDGFIGRHVFFDLKQYITHAAEGSDESDLDEYFYQFDKTFPEACRLHTDKFFSMVGTKGTYKINYYSGVTTSALTKGQYLSDWQTEPWTIAATQSEK